MNSIAEPTNPATKLSRALVMAAIVLAWMAASGEVRAAKPDPMCDGLTGLQRGLCSAATALGCGQSTKHQKQCDVLAARYEKLTGLPPPWEEPVYPSQSVILSFDTDAVDVETGTVCTVFVDGVACNDSDTTTMRPPYVFGFVRVEGEPNPAVLFHNQDCGIGSSNTPGIAFLDGTPFGSVDSSVLATLTLENDLIALPLDPDDTVVLRTCDGNYFKVGNARCNDGVSDACQSPDTGINTVKVDYERLVF
jgi:hypothetical protein